MGIRTILVPFLDAMSSRQAIATALVVARSWEARIVALYVAVDLEVGAPPVYPEAIAAEDSARARTAQALFDRALAEDTAARRRRDPACAAVAASFTVIAGQEEKTVAERARLADLTVVAHPVASGGSGATDAVHFVLFGSHCPVLLATKQPPSEIGQRICVAWNGTAESALAVAAALPWLERAAAVRILTSGEYQRPGPAAAELAAYLTAHDVAVDVSSFHPQNGAVGEGLLSAAQEFGADLMAMGAYSRSRLQQTLFGGVTRRVLERATLPILLCH